MDMGLEPYLLASGIVGVIAQRLMRMICPDCKDTATYPADTLAKVGLKPRIVWVLGSAAWPARGPGTRRDRAECNQTRAW